SESFQHVQGPSLVQLMTYSNRFSKDYPALSDKILTIASVGADDLWVLAGAVNRPENAAALDQSVQHFCEKCGYLRLDLAQKYAARHKAFEKTGDADHDLRFLWVLDFPMFECNNTERRWHPVHLPLSSLHDVDNAMIVYA